MKYIVDGDIVLSHPPDGPLLQPARLRLAENPLNERHFSGSDAV